jgi:hypothetical protein
MELFHKNDVFVMAFSVHAINIFQVLVFVFLNTFKKLKVSFVGDFGDDSVNNHVIEFVQADEQMIMSMTIRGSFHKAGLTPNTSLR